MPLWIALSTLFASSASAQGWWDPQWSSRATLTFDNSAQTEDLVDFPVLVVLDDATNFDHATADASGDDLRFVDADGITELAYEIERWDSGGVSHIWVNVPQVDGASNTDRMYLYWGNSSAPPGENKAGTWRSSYAGVYHLTGNADDSSSPTHHGSTSGPSNAAGFIADGQDFDGNDDEIVLPDESAFDFGSAVSVSFWVQVDGFIHLDWDAFVTKGDQTWRIHRCGAGNTVAWSHNWTSGDGGLNNNTCGSIPVDDGAWHYIVGTYDATMGTKSLYVDGVLDVQVAEARSFATNSDPVWIGNNSDITGRSLDGRMDEVRIEDVGHTSDWIAADYLSVTNAFVSICSPWLGDSDGDGNCDGEDICPGYDDFEDTDGDGVIDCQDLCPFDDPNDIDGDGVCDSVDVCLGYDDGIDTDGDGIPNGCDACALGDSDTDGVPDDCDLCPGYDDAIDTDLDGTADGCDPCPVDGYELDADGDSWFDCDDCDDADPAIHPDAVEVPDNGIDENCDGVDGTVPGTTTTPTGTTDPTTGSGRTWEPSSEQAEPAGPAGCACDHGGSPGSVLLLLLGLVGLRARSQPVSRGVTS